MLVPDPVSLIDCVKFGLDPVVGRLLKAALSVNVSVAVSVSGDEPL